MCHRLKAETDTNEAIVGQMAPDFTLPSDLGGEVTLSALRGQKVILYFYPKDNTSGCTTEALGFEAALPKLKEAGYVVLGVSRDSLKSHASFRQKQHLSFALLSDSDEKVCRLYGVLKLKSMYGRQYMGIERSTFVIDEKGILVEAMRAVKAGKHVGELLEKLLG